MDGCGYRPSGGSVSRWRRCQPTHRRGAARELPRSRGWSPGDDAVGPSCPERHPEPTPPVVVTPNPNPLPRAADRCTDPDFRTARDNLCGRSGEGAAPAGRPQLFRPPPRCRSPASGRQPGQTTFTRPWRALMRKAQWIALLATTFAPSSARVSHVPIGRLIGLRRLPPSSERPLAGGQAVVDQPARSRAGGAWTYPRLCTIALRTPSRGSGTSCAR